MNRPRLPLAARAADRGSVPGDWPRPEHPRPDFWRPTWINLNGEWDFQVDQGDSGFERGLVERPFDATITVPFAPESIASGVANTDFLQAVWYRRLVMVPAEWLGRRILLHFGAVDYDTTVWVDGVERGRHRGGFASFTIEAADELKAQTLEVVVRARDLKDSVQARGKQATWYANSHALYTRTTGIWQTVWAEAVDRTYITGLQTTPALETASLHVRATLKGAVRGDLVVAQLFDEQGEVSRAHWEIDTSMTPELVLPIPPERVRPWSTADPFLYDLRVTVSRDGAEVDVVDSYAGLRGIRIQGDSLLINGHRQFQRLVLDQGYWPESLMTAPSDDELVADIQRSLAVGFNGARLHQKVFEPRYLYHADRLGYLVWGEFGDWGVSGLGPTGDNQRPTAAFVAEWIEVLRRDMNHPSIIGWCPLNETHQVRTDRTTSLDDVTSAMFLTTKSIDSSRPVIDASGYSHRVAESDVYDSHSYEQDPGRFSVEQAGIEDGAPYVNAPAEGDYSVPYAGQPYFVSEFGGIWWEDSAAGGQDPQNSWGYGDRVADREAFYERFAGLTAVLTRNANMFGSCYTQLTDVFQEKNGLYTFDRRPKFDSERLRRIQCVEAAYEERRDGSYER